MKIKNIKVNAYGNLEEKEIKFSDHINIIHGNNESGKSTLVKFISNIFYGTSKNKKGKEFSDYDRYKPWKSEEFSGKLTYELDNGEKFEVFREFGGKKNPKIYNEQKEDIAKQFTIDKTFGNQFFVEQTGVDETMFLSTLVSMQQEVKLDKNIQNALLQKVANLASTGDDSISYKKAQEKINKRQIEEIGTNRSQGRPINIIKEKRFKIQDEIGELENFKLREKEIKQKKEQIKNEIINTEKNIELIKKIKNIKENEKLEQEKIKISENIKQNQEQRKNELEHQKEKIQQIINIKSESEPIDEKQISKTKRNIAISLVIAGVILAVISIIINNQALMAITGILLTIALTWLLIEIRKITKEKLKQEEQRREIKKKELEKQEELKQQQEKIERIEAEISVLQVSIEEEKKQISEAQQKISINQKLEIDKINKQFESQAIEKIKNENVQDALENAEEEKRGKQLEYHSLELEEKTIKPKLEKMAYLEEQLEEIAENEIELEKNNEAIELAKQVLEIAYQKMKQNVTPKLTQELSKNILKISSGKYSKINLHEEQGIIIEKENGEYVEAEKLSVRNNRAIIPIIKACNVKRTS